MPRSTIQASRPVERSLTECLNSEWEEICQSPAEWSEPGLTLAMILESIRFNPNKVLLGLIAACQAGHSVAGRVIVQALLGKLVLLARSHPSTSIANLVSALWIRISVYPVARRREAVAANLVLDSLKDSLRETRALRCLEVVPTDPYTAEGVLEAARALGLASENSLAVLETVYATGMSSHQAAHVYSLTPAAVRRRCSDTVGRLRANASLLAEYAQS